MSVILNLLKDKKLILEDSIESIKLTILRAENVIYNNKNNLEQYEQDLEEIDQEIERLEKV